MKTSNIIRSLFTAILPAIMTITLVGCGGSSGDQYPTRGSLNTLPRDSFSLLSPADGANDVCVNPTINVKLTNTAIADNSGICSNAQAAASVFTIVPKGSGATPINIASAVPRRQSDGSCNIELTTGLLQAGNSYYLCGYDNGSSSRGISDDCREFTTASPEKRCSGGNNFIVQSIANQVAIATSYGKETNLQNGEFPVEGNDINALATLVYKSFFSMLGLPIFGGSIRQTSPIEITFNRAVDMSTVNNISIQIAKFDAFSFFGGGQIGAPVEGVSISSSSASKVVARLPATAANGGYDLEKGAYLVWVNRTIKDATGFSMTSPSANGTVSYMAVINVQ